MFAKVAKEYGVQSVRIPHEDGNLARTLCTRCMQVSEEAMMAKQVYERHGIQCNDAFVGCSLCSVDYTTKDLLKAIDVQIDKLKSAEKLSGKIEVMCHPGFAEEVCGDDGSDERQFNQAPAREKEVKLLCSAEMWRGISDRGLSLVNQKDEVVSQIARRR